MKENLKLDADQKDSIESTHPSFGRTSIVLPMPVSVLFLLRGTPDFR
jgi:hypothetical protein